MKKLGLLVAPVLLTLACGGVDDILGGTDGSTVSPCAAGVVPPPVDPKAAAKPGSKPAAKTTAKAPAAPPRDATAPAGTAANPVKLAPGNPGAGL